MNAHKKKQRSVRLSDDKIQRSQEASGAARCPTQRHGYRNGTAARASANPALVRKTSRGLVVRAARSSTFSGSVEKAVEAMGISPPSCDVSLLSGCAECNSDGSCTCQSYTTAEADLLTRDQTYWGGTINACPTLPILMYVLYSIALLGSTFAGVRCTYALAMQTKLARRLSRRWVEHRPNWVCALLTISILCNAGLCIAKLADPKKVIGVDILMSALYVASRSMLYTGATTQVIDFVAVAMSVQESTYGQQRIRQAVAREHLLYILPAIHTSVASIPLVNAILAVDRDYNMERVQTISLICFLVGNACCFLIGCTRHVFRAKKMLASFEQSRIALETISELIVHGSRAKVSQMVAIVSQACEEITCCKYIASLLDGFLTR
eukprot:6213449-Pleurochrysis_carterae.AAC.3